MNYIVEIGESVLIVSKNDVINIAALINEYDNKEAELLKKGTIGSFVVKHENISVQKLPNEKQ